MNDFRDEFGIPKGYNWEDADCVLGDEEVDAVYIASPNALHAKWVVRALRAGKHVLCEKPIALSLSEIEEITSIAAQGKAVVEENLSYNLTPGYRHLELLRASGEMGRLVSMTIQHMFRATEEHKIRYDQHMGGGSFLDLGCYGVDFVHRLLGEQLLIREVRCERPPLVQRAWTGPSSRAVDARCEVSGHISSGAQVAIRTSFVDESRQSVELSSVEGDYLALPTAFRVECAPSELIRRAGHRETAREEFEPFDIDLAMLTAFAKLVSGEESQDPLRELRWKNNAEVLEEVRMSIREQLSSQ